MTAIPPSGPGLPPDIIVFGPQANCTLDLCPVEYSVYGYRPSLPANIAFTVLFGVAAQIHMWMGIKGQKWFFMATVVTGCLSAAVGYIMRILMYNNPFNFITFMIQLITIGVAPVWYCAAIYVTLSETIANLAPDLSRLRPQMVYWIFIPCDLFALVFQAVGAGLSARTSGNTEVGLQVALFGLGFQLFAILLFCIFLTDYLVRYARSGQARLMTTRVKLFLVFLSLATILMAVRAAFRVYELRDGFTGESMREEAPFIGVDGAVVVVAVYSLLIGHPYFAFGKDGSGRRMSDGEEVYQLTSPKPSR